MCRAVGRGVGSRQKLPQQKRVLEAQQPCQKPCPGLPAPAQKDTSRLRSAVWRGGVHPAGFALAAVPWAAWKPWGRCCNRRRGGQPHGHCPMGTKPHWCSPCSVPASPGRGEQALPGGMAASGMPQLGGCPATGYRSAPSLLHYGPRLLGLYPQGPPFSTPQEARACTMAHECAPWHVGVRCGTWLCTVAHKLANS